MKKTLLFIAASLLATSAFATTYAVVGSYTNPNWNFEASTKLTEGSDGVYTCTIEKLTSDFKIVDIDVDNWADQWGTSTPIEINTVYTLTAKNGGDDPSNIKFAGLIQSVSNALVKWTPATASLEIVATDSDLEIAYPTLYFTGNWNGNNWPAPGEGSAPICTENNGVYTVTIDLGTQANTEFKLAGAGWSNEIAGGVEVGTDAAQVTLGGSNLKTTLTGTQTLRFNYHTMLMTFGADTDIDTPLAPAPRTWAVVGAYTEPNWNFDASTKFTLGDDGVYTCTIEKLISGFKIVDITNNNWDTQYGTSERIAANTEYTLTGKVGDTDAPNIEFGGLLQEINNALVKWNPETLVMEIVADASNLVYEYPTLYFTGDWNGNNWPEPTKDGSLLCSRNEAVYTVTVDLGEQTYTEFKLAGAGWSNEVAGGVQVGTSPVAVTMGGSNLNTILTGERVLTFNMNTMEMFFSDITSGVENINIDSAIPAVYFNLQGVQVENPSNGLYIIRQGDKTSKVFIR